MNTVQIRNVVGAILKARADHFGLTTADLSRMTGIAQSSVSRILSRKQEPTIGRLLSLLAALHSDLAWIGVEIEKRTRFVWNCRECGSELGDGNVKCFVCGSKQFYKRLEAL